MSEKPEDALAEVIEKYVYHKSEAEKLAQLFERYGIDPSQLVTHSECANVMGFDRGHIVKSLRRHQYNESGREVVMKIVEENADRGVTTAQIMTRWRELGRYGRPDQVIYALLREDMIRREHKTGIRGSVYFPVDKQRI